MVPKKEVLLVRHGRSLTNETDQYQSGDQFSGDPLSAEGDAQAQLLAQEFDNYDYKPDAIVASYYQRPMQTARYVGAVVGTRIIVPVYDTNWNITDVAADTVTPADGKSLFRELDLPAELAGKHYGDEQALAIKRAIHEHRFEQDWHYSTEENLYDIWQRAGKCVEYLAARPEDKIVVVAHGGIIKACLGWIQFAAEEDWTMKQKLQAYQAFTKVAWDDNTGIVSLFQDRQKQEWQWLISYNRHLNTTFGFMSQGPSGATDTAAEHIHD